MKEIDANQKQFKKLPRIPGIPVYQYNKLVDIQKCIDLIELDLVFIKFKSFV